MAWRHPSALPAILIFAATYLVVAIGRLPGFRVDRTGAAIIGAILMVACNVLTPGHRRRGSYQYRQRHPAAVRHDDRGGEPAALGIFRASDRMGCEARAPAPHVLLAAIAAVSGVFSAFFVNDTMCSGAHTRWSGYHTPTHLRRNPVPYLLAVAMASNIGSVATMTGNPQNMLVGSFSGIHYREFAAALSPVAAAGLVAVVVVIALAYRSEFLRGAPKVVVQPPPVRVHRALAWKSSIASAGMIVLFFLGWPIAKVALVTGALLLVTRRVKPERVYAEIDWSLLVLFIGLFIVVRGVEKTSLSSDLFAIASRLHLERPAVMSAFAAGLSNIVSNVPAVLVFRPFIPHLADPKHAWLTLAMSSTLAGNLTVLGSVANLIVIQRARHQVRIGFWEYARVGAPLTVITITLGVLLLG